MLTRLACPRCEVLTTDDLNAHCWCCDEPMILATQFQNPASSPFSNPILAVIAAEE